MTNFDERYVDENLNRQLAIARAKQYSAKCFHKRNRRNYVIAAVAGILLSLAFWAWQLTRPEPVLVESAETSTQYSEMPEPAPSAETEPLGEFELTAYCSCETCCGKWALNRPLDEAGEPIVYTASGAVAEAGVTVAVDPDVIPLGSTVVIAGQEYIAEDIGGAIQGNRIDVYMASHEAAEQAGVKYAEVLLYE